MKHLIQTDSIGYEQNKAMMYNRIIVDKQNKSVYCIKKDEYKTVDLGLTSGTLWCDRNIGAKSPTDVGLYFAWGEIVGYTAEEISNGVHTFDFDSYKYGHVEVISKDQSTTTSMEMVTKYIPDTDLSECDGLYELEIIDDAAYQNTNGSFIIPSPSQLIELFQETNVYMITNDGNEIKATYDEDSMSCLLNNDSESIKFKGFECRNKIDENIKLFFPTIDKEISKDTIETTNDEMAFQLNILGEGIYKNVIGWGNPFGFTGRSISRHKCAPVRGVAFVK